MIVAGDKISLYPCHFARTVQNTQQQYLCSRAEHCMSHTLISVLVQLKTSKPPSWEGEASLIWEVINQSLSAFAGSFYIHWPRWSYQWPEAEFQASAETASGDLKTGEDRWELKLQPWPCHYWPEAKIPSLESMKSTTYSVSFTGLGKGKWKRLEIIWARKGLALFTEKEEEEDFADNFEKKRRRKISGNLCGDSFRNGGHSRLDILWLPTVGSSASDLPPGVHRVSCWLLWQVFFTELIQVRWWVLLLSLNCKTLASFWFTLSHCGAHSVKPAVSEAVSFP